MKSTKKPFQIGIIIGALLTASPLLGFFITAFGMFRAFFTLQNNGISDPRALSSSVALVLYSNAVGLVLCPIGVAVLIISLVLRARARHDSPPLFPPTPPP